MSTHHTTTGKVVRVIRHGHTMYGNPILSVVLEYPSKPERDTGLRLLNGEPIIEGGEHPQSIFRISDNAGLVYEIDNPEYKAEPHTFAKTRAGRISHVIKG